MIFKWLNMFQIHQPHKTVILAPQLDW